MSWVGVAVGTTALGAVQGAQQRKAQQRANQQSADISAAQEEFSPWTGQKPQEAKIGAVTGSPLQGAVQGALTGAMFGKQFSGAPSEPTPAQAPMAGNAMPQSVGAGGVNPLGVQGGSAGMADQFAQYGQYGKKLGY